MRGDWRLSVDALPRVPFSGAKNYPYDARYCKEANVADVRRCAELHDLACGNTLASAKPDQLENSSDWLRRGV